MTDTPIVTLRARTDADADALYALTSELDTWEERSPLSPAPMTRAQYEARDARAVDSTLRDVQFVIDVDGAAAGVVSLFDRDDFARHAEVGIAVVAGFRGKGIGTEAMRQIVEFAFVRCNLRRVHLEVLSSNAAGIRCYEKVGFVIEGRQREHAWVRGEYVDNVRMGLLRAEFGA